MQTGLGCFKERRVKLMDIALAETEFRQLKLKRAQHGCNLWRTRYMDNFQAGMTHQRRQYVVADPEVFHYRLVRPESRTDRVERQWRRRCQAGSLCGFG